MPDPAPPVGRLAPSPTGQLHVGHARSFLLAWWHLRSRGGRVVLRIEDLDAARVQPGFVDALLRDLEWLGLDWDGEPHVQSSDTQPMQRAVEQLLERGLAYACVCSRREIHAGSAPHAGDAEPRYPGTCRDRFASLAAAERESGVPAGVRFRVPPGVLEIEDALVGAYRTDVAHHVGDFVVLRRDGVFAYQLAVVVDDARQGVTEVLRGDDLLSSTPRQSLLQDALGLPHPRWYHVPLVVDDDAERLAKRRSALALASLRERHVDSRALVAWIARSAGQDCPERAAASDVVEGFRLERLPRRPVVFGRHELAELLSRRA